MTLPFLLSYSYDDLWFWRSKSVKSFIFSRYLYISIVFFSYVICATEFLLLNTIQKYLWRFPMRWQETAWELEVICPWCMWTAFLHDTQGFPKAVRRYTIIFIEVIWTTQDNIPRLEWGWVHYFQILHVFSSSL